MQIRLIIISYDADLLSKVRESYFKRGLDILRKSGDVRVLSVPSGKRSRWVHKDLRQKEAFQALIDKNMPLIDYKIKK